MLSNPIYGGAYTYGKTERTIRYEQGEPRTSSRRRPREEWLALIPHAHEGYVSWEEFERIRQTMAANVRGWQHTGAGHAADPALLTGSAALSTLWAEIGRLLHWQRAQRPALHLRPRRAR